MDTLIDEVCKNNMSEFVIGLPLQIAFCTNRGLEMFAPLDGKCYSCGRELRDNSNELITGCNWCHRSFVD